MSLPGTVAGTIGRFEADAPDLQPFTNGGRGAPLRVLDVPPTLTDGSTTHAKAACEVEVTRPDVRIDDTLIEIDRTKAVEVFATRLDRLGRVVVADSTTEDGSGTFPFTLLSATTNVPCRRLNVDTDALREAWQADGTLSDTWLAGSRDGGNGSGTVMAYGEASENAKSDIGLGFERAWEGFMLRGVVYQSGYVSVFEDLDALAFLTFVGEELVPHGYVPERDDGGEQTTLGDE